MYLLGPYLHPISRGFALRGISPYSLSGWPLNLHHFTGAWLLIVQLSRFQTFTLGFSTYVVVRKNKDFPAIHEIYFDVLLRKEAGNRDLGLPPAAPP
jgi:hypothetical protein